MRVLILKIHLRASWVHSLKEKRMIVKSITKKLQNNFNVSVGEVENQDVHQMITIGIASIDISSSQSDLKYENIVKFIEETTDAQIIKIEKDCDIY